MTTCVHATGLTEVDRYAVVGNPVAHSLSPRIHSEFARQTGESLSYGRLELPIDGFDAGVERFFADGGQGLNVTVPFKQEAYRFVHRTEQRARRAGAVNTIFRDGDLLVGDNTDGVGLLRDLVVNLGWTVRGANVLLLGAGGAVRGVLGPLLEEAPACVVIANRTESRAESLARAFSGGVPLLGIGLERLGSETRRFDLVINGTSSGLAGEAPDLPGNVVGDGSCCYDMMYGAGSRPFLQWGAARGAEVADGLGMLVEQAAESFRIWRGVRPETTPVIAMLRDESSTNR